MTNLLRVSILTAALTLTSALAPSMAQAVKPFDCGSLTQAEVDSYSASLSANALTDLAKTCDEQATTFEKLASEAREAIEENDSVKLHSKAATAYAHVAIFTNMSLMK